MSAYMIDSDMMVKFGSHLIAHLASHPMGHTARYLTELWPAHKCFHPEQTAIEYRVSRLLRLMRLANKRAMWHRYTLGRTGNRREPLMCREEYELPGVASWPRVWNTITTTNLAKFVACVIYQCSEYNNEEPRVLTVINQFRNALATEALESSQEWHDAPWGSL